MPRYYFHIENGVTIMDMLGTDLAGDVEARDEAVKTAGEMMKDQGARFWSGTEWSMLVMNTARSVVCRIRVAADQG